MKHSTRIRGLLAVVAVSVCAMAQNAQVRPTQTFSAPTSGDSNLPVQKIGVDDLIGVNVYDAPEFTKTVRVSADGTIRLPMLKQPIKVLDMLPPEIERSITEALKSSEILVDPVVTVSVVEYRSRPINVVGAVKKPVTFQAYGDVTLLDALAKAEGLNDEAGAEILVTRSEGQGRTAMTQRIPVRQLIDGADASLNVKLSGGEDIRVPTAGKVYVVGNVKKPGAFMIRDTTDPSILKLLALSEGLEPYSSNEAYIYRAPDGKQERTEIPVALKKIIDRKAPDITLLPNDVLYIPDRAGKRMVMTTLGKGLGLGGGLASALIYAGVK
jgi:polysaccharide export outer membrane protein